MNIVTKSLFLIIFLGCFCSCTGSKKLVQSGSRVEVTERDFKNEKKDWKNKYHNIRVEFYDRDNKNEPIGLMLVSINEVHFIAEMDGVFERTLYTGNQYKFKFYAPGFEVLKDEIKIQKNKEYLVKVFIERKEDVILK